LKAAGVNPVDTYIRSGQYTLRPNLPYTPGMDGAGVIKTVGKDIKHYAPGDRVYVNGSLTGTYAQQTLCLSQHIFSLPDNLSFQEGAAIGIPYTTAYRALFTKAKALAGDTVFIHGASGGVGIAALQLAKAADLRTIASAGSDKGLALLKEQGADLVINHKQANYLEQVVKFTEGRGVNVILEMLANMNLKSDTEILAKEGRIIVIGSRGPTQINPRELMIRDASIVGMLASNMTGEERTKIFSALEEGLQKGKLHPVIGEELPLGQAKKAHKKVLESGAYGKIVLIP
jgi:NADPH2:quinone reductase